MTKAEFIEIGENLDAQIAGMDFNTQRRWRWWRIASRKLLPWTLAQARLFVRGGNFK